VRPNRTQARILLELMNHDNLIISTKDQMGRRYARWKNKRGKLPHRAGGKPGVGTFRAFRKRGWIETEDAGVGTWRISELGISIASSLDPDWYDKRPRKIKVTANDVLKALDTYYADSGLIVIPEVSIAYGGERRADALVVGRGNETAIAIEIKVSRQDFKHELDDEDKRADALELSSQYFFATPQGLVDTHLIPDECGLLELGVDGKIRVTVPAPRSRPSTPDWRLVSAVARALKR